MWSFSKRLRETEETGYQGLCHLLKKKERKKLLDCHPSQLERERGEGEKNTEESVKQLFSVSGLQNNSIGHNPLLFTHLNGNVKSLSHVRLFATTWTVAYQGPPSMGFSRQEYWSGLPFPSPGDLPNLGIKPRSPTF